MLSFHFKDTNIIQAEDWYQVQEICDRDIRFDLLSLDLAMPGIAGWSTVTDVAIKQPMARIAIVSASEDTRGIQASFESGAHAYIPKSMSAKKTMAAIDNVKSGNIYMPDLYHKEYRGPTSNVMNNLTPIEFKVASLVGEGKNNRSISSILGISQYMVKRIISNIKLTFGVSKRIEIVIFIVNQLSRPDIQEEIYSDVSLQSLSFPIRIFLRIVDRWGLSALQASWILGMNDGAIIGRLRKGECHWWSTSMDVRVKLLYQVFEGLLNLFRNREIEYDWLNEEQLPLDGRCPIQLTFSGKLEDLVQLRDFVYFISGR